MGLGPPSAAGGSRRAGGMTMSGACYNRVGSDRMLREACHSISTSPQTGEFAIGWLSLQPAE